MVRARKAKAGKDVKVPKKKATKVTHSEDALYYGDNLPVLRDKIKSESIDLIYLDPPFNSNANYNVLFGGNGKSQAQIHAFQDTWHWGPEAETNYADVMAQGGRAADVLEALRRFLGDNDMMAYLAMMTPRLIELKRVLKKTGSIYLHCDPTASHYLKLIMDAVFGVKHFQNEIIWHYRKWSTGKYQFQRNHDVIFFYSASDTKDRVFNQLYMERAASTLKRFGTARIISGYDEDGRRLPAEMAEEESLGVRQDDVWDIGRVPPIKQLFPTQKPEKLLDRIIRASSNEGDVVLDPFCGCGTAVVVAQQLRRRWIGIDITHLAIGLIEFRLQDAFGIRPKVLGAPEDLDGARNLFERDPFQFEAWAVTRILGIKPNESQRGDGGIDGVGRFYLGRDGSGKEQYGKILVSVKGGKKTGVAMIRDFRGAMEREKAELGVFISLSKPTADMTAEAARAGRYREIKGRDFPRIQIFTVEDYFEGRRPDLPPTIEDARKRADAMAPDSPRLL